MIVNELRTPQRKFSNETNDFCRNFAKDEKTTMKMPKLLHSNSEVLQSDPEIMNALQDLISKCVSFDPNERPTFIQTTEILQSLFIDSFIKYKKTQESEQQFISILQKYSYLFQ